MTNRITILLLLFAFATLRLCAESPMHNPPEVKSEIGYLTVEKQMPLPSVTERIFILPQVTLLLLQETDDAFKLVYPAKKYSSACTVPKYAKFTIMMIRDSKNKKVSFRGGLEVDTIPLVLKKGEELPVKEKVEGGYIALVQCNDEGLPFFIPEDLEGISFQKESAFAVFAKDQREKGLKYFNGVWMPIDKVKALTNRKKVLDEKKIAIWKDLKNGAEEGVVVLKNKKVLHGKLKGNDSSHILFQSSGKNYWLGIDDVEPLSFEQILMRGNIEKADGLIKIARKTADTDMGMARKRAEDAVSLVVKITKKNPYEHELGLKITDAARKLLHEIDNKLEVEQKVIYDNTVFPDYVVRYHKDMGHILLKRKFWIRPEQKCANCQASGAISCPVCKGKGRKAVTCIVCKGKGKIKCPKCEGSGWRVCNICGGKGYVYKKGSPRSYSYFGTGYYYPRYWRPGRIITNGRMIAMTAPSPVFCGPTFSGTYISSGGSGGNAVKAVCWKCGGTGTIQCPKYITCKACHGQGENWEICLECKGKKSVPCTKCRGKGFTGAVQKLPTPFDTDKIVP